MIMKKNLCLYTALFLMSLVFFSCKKGDTGPAGPAGPAGSQGPQGPQGIQGNANATQYTFGTQDFAASTFRSFGITTTQDTVNNSTWLVYLYATNSRWYFIPGYGFGGATQYRVSLAYESSKAVVYVDKSGAGESYSKARVIRIYNNTNITVTGNSNYPDLNDYQAVSAYYHLSD
jgi:hypothetical protein